MAAWPDKNKHFRQSCGSRLGLPFGHWYRCSVKRLYIPLLLVVLTVQYSANVATVLMASYKCGKYSFFQQYSKTLVNSEAFIFSKKHFFVLQYVHFLMS